MLQPLASILAALLVGAAAHAQSPPPAQQVHMIAPHLVAFTGSSANFESLVSGLAHAQPVTLTSVGPDGVVQIVTFLPPHTMTPAEAARVLEAARQTLIMHGIAQPSAHQLAVVLAGGVLVTPASASVTLPSLLDTALVPIELRTELGVPVVPGALPVGASPAQVEGLRHALMRGTLSGVPMTVFEANVALHMAQVQLALHGIFAPTLAQLELALRGGTLTGPAGAVIPIHGVLHGTPRHTSDSTQFGTSHSRVLGTSHSPPSAFPPITPPPAIAAPPAGALQIAPPVTPRLGVAR